MPLKIDRDIAYKQFLVAQDPYERKFADALVPLFTAQEARVIAAMGGSKAFTIAKTVDNWLPNAGQEAAVFFQATWGIYEDILVNEGQASLDFLGLDQVFLVQNVDLGPFVDKVKLSHWHVQNNTRNRLRDTLQAGLEAGEGISELQERVEITYDQARGFRAETIARTETVKAFNFSRIAGYAQSQVVSRKEWLSTRDNRTRGNDVNDEFDHLSPDGQVSNLHGFFDISGEQLAYPGDPSASPGNIINCRCTVLPVIDD